ncbi:MAG: hypothetical protein HC895_22570 [Leptolyngbyaceae cyanobacterium SM1_3_5]|nr:hypothetical protein [Leptolyngbyaceae cyanobacterium SM1_3_5]
MLGITMTLQELQEQALKLSIEERWQLVYVLMRSLQPNLQSIAKIEALVQMANDPEIQAEIRSIDAEFAVAEQDGLLDV